MATTVGQLTIDMAADIARLRKDMDRATGVVENAMSRVSRSVGKVQALLGSLAVGGGFAASIGGIVRSLDALNDAADATGASLNKLAGLERLARINGGNLDQVTAAIVKLNQQLNGSDGADSKAAIALKALGLEVDKLKKLDPADAIVEVGRALNRFADDGDKARLAQTLFGKSLRELAPLLKDIGNSTGEYAVEAAKAAQEAEKFAKNAAALGFVFEGLGRSLAGPVLEGLNAFIERVQVAQRAGQGLASSLIGAGLLGEGDLGNAERALAAAQDNLGRTSNPEVRANLERRITQLNRQVVEERRRLGLDQSVAPLPSVAANVADAERAAEAEKKLESARKASADAAKRLAEEERKRREGIAIELADQRLLIALVQQGNTVDEAQLRISLARKGLSAAEIEQSVALKAQLSGLLDIRKMAADEAQAEIRAQAEFLRQREAEAVAAAERTADLEQQIRQQQIENDTLGLTGVQLALVEASRIREAAAQKMQDVERLRGEQGREAEIEQIQKQIVLLGKLADERIAGAVKREDIDRAREAIEVQKREAEGLGRIFQDVGRSLTDSLFRGFEAGKGFLRSFKDAIVNSFKSFVVRFIAQPVIGSVIGSIGGALGFPGVANAAGGAGGFGGGFLDALSGGKTIFDALSGNFTSGLSSFASTLGNAGFSSGASFVNGFASALNGGSAASFSGASSAFNLGNFAGNAAPFIPGIVSAFQGDFKTAAFQTAGAAIGTAFGGPIGGAIGSTIGSIVSGLIGGGGPKAIRTTIRETAPGEFSRIRGKDGFLDNGRVDPTLTGINEQFRATLEGLLGREASGIRIASSAGLFDNREQSSALFRVKDLAGEVIAALDITGTAKQLGKNIQRLATESLGAPLRDVFLSLATDVSDTVRGFLNETDDNAEVQKRLAGFIQLKDASARLSENLGLTVDQVIQMTDGLGGIESTLGLLNGILADLPVTQDDINRGLSKVAEQFGELGVVMPTTAQGFRDLIESIDKTTPEGLELVQSILKLAPAFAAATNAAEAFAQRAREIEAAAKETLLGVLTDINNAVQNQVGVVMGILARQESATAAAQQALDDALAGQGDLAAEQADVLRSATDNLRDIVEALRDFRRSLIDRALDAAGPNVIDARQRFLQVAQQAQAGNLTAASELPQLGDRFLDIALEQSATYEDFLRELALVSQAVDATDTRIGQSISAADQQLAALDAQVAALSVVETSTVDIAKLTKDLETARAAEKRTRETLVELGFLTDATEDIDGELLRLRELVATQQQANAQISNLEGINAKLLTLPQQFAEALANFLAARDDATIAVAAAAAASAAVAAIPPVDIPIAAGAVPVEGFEQVGPFIPGFASGGMFGGGLRLVGERGPELESTGPSRIWSAQQTREMLSPTIDMSGVERRLDRLENVLFAVAKSSGKTADQLKRWDVDGVPEVRVAV